MYTLFIKHASYLVFKLGEIQIIGNMYVMRRLQLTDYTGVFKSEILLSFTQTKNTFIFHVRLTKVRKQGSFPLYCS